eukprot:141672-Hanusia_phi.AAC.1
MSLHSELRDKSNRNSNIFSLVPVGRSSCVLAVFNFKDVAPPRYPVLNEDTDNFYVFLKPDRGFILVRFETEDRRTDAL